MTGPLRTFLLVTSMLNAHAADAGGPPSIDEMAEQKVIIDAVKGAIDRKDYKALDAMENEFQKTRSRTVSGVWKLSLFHWRLLTELGPHGDEGRCDDRSTNFFQGWLAASPTEPAPYISRAAVIEAYAWCIRGDGFADSVSEQAFEQFAAKVEESREILSQHQRVASIDPEYYAVMEQIYLDQGAGKVDFKRLLEEATSREPNYHQLYYRAYQYYEPQWYGSDAEIDELARYAAARTTRAEGLGMYARYYWHALRCGCSIDRSVNWPTMKEAMRDVMARYPSDWNAANFARISCLMNDAEEAKIWFDRVKGTYGDAWTDKEAMHRCESMAHAVRSTASAAN